MRWRFRREGCRVVVGKEAFVWDGGGWGEGELEFGGIFFGVGDGTEEAAAGFFGYFFGGEVGGVAGDEDIGEAEGVVFLAGE